MDRRRAATAALALLAVLAAGIAGGALEDVDTGGAGLGAGGGGGPGAGAGEEFDLGAPDNATAADGFGVPYLGVVVRLLLVAFLLAALAGLVPLYDEYGLRGIAGLVLVGVVGAFLLFSLVELLEGSGGFGQGSGGFLGRGEPTLPGGGVPGAETTSGPVADPAVALGLLFGLAAVVGLAALLRATGDDDPGGVPEAPEPSRPDGIDAVGRAAGAAADRIEAGADADNEVYRAWREMTDRLAVPRTDATTPAEFADAAVAAGFEREDVAELTRLFEEVRYGDAPATADREERAVAALRRIERAVP